MLKHLNTIQYCLALCYFSANCFYLRLFIKKFAVNRRFWKTPYQCEYQPVWKTQGESDGDAMPQLYIAWSSVEGCWCISDNMGKKLASMDAKSAKFGFDKVCLPDGYVSVPALNPSYGTSGKSKFRCVACKLVDQYATRKKRKALAAASSKAAGPKSKFARLIPRGSVALKGQKRSMKPLNHLVHLQPIQLGLAHGWLMKTKDLVVAYKNRDWHRFDELSKEQLADIYIYIVEHSLKNICMFLFKTGIVFWNHSKP